MVPVDDTNCFSIGWSDIDKTLTLPRRSGYVDRRAEKGGHVVGAGDVGQTGEPSYEDRQRAPGDWDAWSSQGPITLHSREHLGTTDRGVTLYRKLLRRGIRAVARGKTPKGLTFGGSEQRPTYCHNTVARIPKAGSEAKDEALKLAFGREVTRRILGNEYPKDTLGCADPDRLAEVRRVLGVE